jgi:AraC-like DNA-binding protein
MNSAAVAECLSSAPSSVSSGLFRELLAGRGCSLPDAFRSLEDSALPQQTYHHRRRNLFAARVPVDSREGRGHWEFTRIGRSMYVIIANVAYKQARLEYVPGDDLIQFFFTLSGDLTIEGIQPQLLHIKRPSLLVYQQPRGVDTREWTVANAAERFVAISFHRRYLIEEFFPSGGQMPAALEPIVNSDQPEVPYCQIALSAEMFELATRLVEQPYNGSLGVLFTEAVAFQLLCRTISALHDVNATLPYERYSERDLRGLHAARAMLKKQLAPAPTIPQLARQVGINETSLKRGFKALFGETIFDFSVRCRMEQAMALLREGQMPVGLVSEAVGYSHQTSFATAFRRHFGVSPKDARPPAAH